MFEESETLGEIPAQLSRLHFEIQGLTENVKMLGSKLNPIRSKCGTNALSDNKPCSQNPPICEMAAQLKGYTTQIESLSQEILSIHRSVEL